MADQKSAAASALGIDSMKVIAGATGGDTLSQMLLGQVKEQQDNLKRKANQAALAVTPSAAMLLGNATGGFGV